MPSPLVPIAQLLTAPTQPQIRAMLVTLLVGLNVPADKWRKGGSLSTILTVASIILNGTAILVAQAINGFFLPLARGQGLVNLAFYLYGVTAPQPTQATGQFTFVNSGSGVFAGPSYAAGQVIVEDPATGQTYVTTDNLNIGAFGSGTASQTVGIKCQQFGTIGNANPGDIDEIVTTMVGVTGSNPSPVIGSDGLSDAALRSLCLASLGARSVRGPRGAYQYAIQTATNAVTGAPVNINRWYISPASSSGTVTIYLASPTGVPDANDVAGVIANIQGIGGGVSPAGIPLGGARPGGVTANTSAAATVNYTGTAVLSCSLPSGVTQAQLAAAAATSLAAFMSTYDIGGATAQDDANPGGFTGLLASAAYAACASGVATLGATFYGAKGLTDLALSLGQVAVDNVTIQINVIVTSNP